MPPKGQILCCQRPPWCHLRSVEQSISGAEGNIMWPEDGIFKVARGHGCDIDIIIWAGRCYIRGVILGQYAMIREAVLTNIHRQTREKTEWKTRGGEATECFSRGFFSSLEWIFEILLSEAQHIAIIPRFLVATTNSDEYWQISNTSLSTVAPKNVE